MPIILDDETPRKISVRLRDIVPRRRPVRLPTELNSIFVVIVVRLKRRPILIDERFTSYPPPSSPWFNRTCGLNSPKPRPVPAIPDRCDLSRYIEYKCIFLSRRDCREVTTAICSGQTCIPPGNPCRRRNHFVKMPIPALRNRPLNQLRPCSLAIKKRRQNKEEGNRNSPQ